MTVETKAIVAPVCDKHPNCCYSPDCAAEFNYNPSTGKTTFVRCSC